MGNKVGKAASQTEVERNVVGQNDKEKEKTDGSKDIGLSSPEVVGLSEEVDVGLSEENDASADQLNENCLYSDANTTTPDQHSYERLNPQQAEVSSNSGEQHLDMNLQEPSRSRKNSLTNFSKETIQSIKRKTSNLVAPKNIEVATYCRDLINVSFHGQVTVKTELELYQLLDGGSSSYTLAALLQSFHKFLNSFGDVENLTGDEEECRYFVQELMKRRNQNDMDKFWKDAYKFVDIYKERGGNMKGSLCITCLFEFPFCLVRILRNTICCSFFRKVICSRWNDITMKMTNLL